MIKKLVDVSGGVGAIIGFAHDWANPENTRRIHVATCGKMDCFVADAPRKQ
jgi:hypothetical protein